MITSNKWRLLSGLSYHEWRTGREIREEIGINNYVFFYFHLNSLEEEGYIESRIRDGSDARQPSFLDFTKLEYKLTSGGIRKRSRLYESILSLGTLSPVRVGY